MNIREAGAADREAWDDFVQSHRKATPYHAFAWKEAIEQAYGHRGHYLLAEDRGGIVGVLPLVLMGLPLLYRRLVSLPFCDRGGPLAADEDVVGSLYHAAHDLAARLRAGTLEIRSLDEIPGQRGLAAPSSVRTDKVSMLLTLPSGSERLWDGFKSKLRSQVRKAEKNDLVFRWGEMRDRGAFYRVFSRNMLELGSPVHSRGWIDAVLDHYGEKAGVGLVFLADEPAGAGIVLEVADMVCVPWASTLREYNHLAPNMLLYWNFLQHAADTGRTRFDFGRSTYGEGTFRFKEQWGAEPRTLYWHTWHHGRERSGRESVAASPPPDRALLASLWARLPLCAANALGPTVRRHISL